MAENRCHIGTVLSGHLPQKRRRGDFLLIECENLSFSYDGKRDAISDISLTLEKGEYLSLLGANGSGKSTLLKVLDLILPYSRGRLSILGMDARDKNARKIIRRNIGFVFQNPEAAFISRTVLDEVMFSPLNFGFSKDEARAMALSALSEFGLDGYDNALLKELSGGEKQRLMLASVFVMESEIIILDEAFSFLDMPSKALLTSAIGKRKRKGAGIISVTHDAEVASSSDRLVLLENGRVRAEGRSEELLKDVELLISSDIRVRDEDLFNYVMSGGSYDFS